MGQQRDLDWLRVSELDLYLTHCIQVDSTPWFVALSRLLETSVSQRGKQIPEMRFCKSLRPIAPFLLQFPPLCFLHHEHILRFQAPKTVPGRELIFSPQTGNIPRHSRSRIPGVSRTGSIRLDCGGWNLTGGSEKVVLPWIGNGQRRGGG